MIKSPEAQGRPEASYCESFTDCRICDIQSVYHIKVIQSVEETNFSNIGPEKFTTYRFSEQEQS